MNKRHYEHTLPNIRGSLSNTYGAKIFLSVVERIFSLHPCPIVPATFKRQKNNPGGRKQAEQRETNKTNKVKL